MNTSHHTLFRLILIGLLLPSLVVVAFTNHCFAAEMGLLIVSVVAIIDLCVSAKPHIEDLIDRHQLF